MKVFFYKRNLLYNDSDCASTYKLTHSRILSRTGKLCWWPPGQTGAAFLAVVANKRWNTIRIKLQWATYCCILTSWSLAQVYTTCPQVHIAEENMTANQFTTFVIMHYNTYTLVLLYKYHHSTKLYQKISRVCCRLYCYECAAQVTMPTATNEWYFFQYSLVLWW